jgi:endonuclease YncB( thermonuclease family)
MIKSWSGLARAIVVSLCLLCSATWGAERKKWVMLTGCQYVPHTDNDGDSFHVRCAAAELVVRLYFVDAPETNLRYPERTREQSEHFGATLDQTMKAGAAAGDLVRETLKEPFTIWTRWASAAGRSRQRRYYGLVKVSQKWLAEILVSRGLARTKGVTTNLPTGENWREHADRLDSLEAEAKRQRIGAWASPTTEKPEKTSR